MSNRRRDKRIRTEMGRIGSTEPKRNPRAHAKRKASERYKRNGGRRARKGAGRSTGYRSK